MFRNLIKTKANQPVRLGILKGGQLGRMLMQACMNYDLQGIVMDKDPNCPCSHFASEFVTGDARNFEDVYRFGKTVDILTLEVEDINVEALEALEQEGLPVFPQPALIRLIQDKGLQKQFYKKHGFPTAEFHLLDKGIEMGRYPDFFPAVLKTRRSGYDGKGVRIFNGLADCSVIVDEPSVLEKKVDFIKEISVIAARNQKGECVVYPVAELMSDPKKHLLDFLAAPSDIPTDCREKAQRIALEIIEQMKLIGLLAVEMFVTARDEVLVNEISPRPHNSGHHTIEANVTSQFEQHLRAIMNLPLGSTQLRSPSVMINVLGEPGYHGVPRYEGIEEILSVPGVYLHLYGKSRTEPYRKMGHVTVLDEDISKAKRKALWVKEKIRVKA